MLIRIRQALTNFHKDQRGAALVEMTLITPLMLALSAGVFEFSNIIHTKLLIEAGTHDGARYIARCRRGSNATYLVDCESDGRTIAVQGVVRGAAGAARVYGWTAGMVTVGYTAIPVINDPITGEQNYHSSGPLVETVRVSTSYNYQGTGLWTYLGFGALTLTAAHEERVVGN